MSKTASDTRCCSCTDEGVALVLDGSLRKPVCATHRRIYSKRGYLIDALPHDQP